jgi:hypothetical protein
VFYPSDKVVKFKIVLPFQYTSAVSNVGLEDVYLSATPAATGSVLMMLGFNSSVTQATGKVLALSATTSLDFSGRSVSNAGDVNGDGYDDLIIGVPFDSKCFVLFGTVNGFMNMTEGFTIFGAQSSDLTGWSVSGAGDVNSDAFADIIIGAPMSVQSGKVSGTVYVIYGGSHLGHTSINLDALTQSDGFIVSGSSDSEYFGVSVAAAGEFSYLFCSVYRVS